MDMSVVGIFGFAVQSLLMLRNSSCLKFDWVTKSSGDVKMRILFWENNVHGA